MHFCRILQSLSFYLLQPNYYLYISTAVYLDIPLLGLYINRHGFDIQQILNISLSKGLLTLILCLLKLKDE